jgi:phage terminase large subunit
MRIEAVRRIVPRCRFDEKACEAGIEALGFYHEKEDEQRSVGLGPLHNWSSHGLMAINYEDPQRVARFNRKLEDPRLVIV